MAPWACPFWQGTAQGVDKVDLPARLRTDDGDDFTGQHPQVRRCKATTCRTRPASPAPPAPARQATGGFDTLFIRPQITLPAQPGSAALRMARRLAIRVPNSVTDQAVALGSSQSPCHVPR